MDRALSSFTTKLRSKSSKELGSSSCLPREHPTDPAAYELLEDCGRGVSATVHRALVKATGEVVAVKKMNLERVAMSLEEIIREAKTMKSYHHPNVLPLYTSFVHGQDLWMVTPFMSGGSVLHIMKYGHPEGLDEVSIATIMKYVLLGLEYVHKNGGIHRDVKAGNILIDRDGTVRIGDFGVAATIERGGSWGSSVMPRTTFVGTPCWMAPEVMEQTDYDTSADIWSFGITILELANGHAPFAKFPPMKVLLMTLQNPPPQLDDKQGHKHFSKHMRNLVARCLQKDPRSRPSATELLNDRFFKQARDEEFLMRTLMTDLPALGERVQEIRVGKAATNAAENDKQLERSQEEYVKGVSCWNFDLQALKAEAAAMEPILEGNEAADAGGEGSGSSSRRSTDDAAALPLQQQAESAAPEQQPAAGAAVPQPALPLAQQQETQQRQLQQLPPQQQQQQLQQQLPQQQQQQAPPVALSQQQQQQQQGGLIRRAASAFAGSAALAAAAAAGSSAAGAVANGGGSSSNLHGHFSEPAAVANQPGVGPSSAAAGAMQHPPGSAAAAAAMLGSSSSSYCLSPLTGSPPMSRESSSQGPLGALASTPEAIPLKGKSKGRHGRFQVYEHGEEPPPMSPPAARGVNEGLAGSFTRSSGLLSSEGRVSDSAASATDTPRQAFAAADMADLAAAAAVAAGGPPASVVNLTSAAGAGALPPAAPAVPPAGGSGSVDGADAAGGAEPKKRGRFKIIEEEGPPSLSRSSFSKVPSSNDLSKPAGARPGGAAGAAVLPELLRLHEQAVTHQAALARLIDGVKANGSHVHVAATAAGGAADGAAEGDASAAAAAPPQPAVARKLSVTGWRSAGSSSFAGRALAGCELGRVTLATLLPLFEGDAGDLAERLLERGQELERRLQDLAEENSRLRELAEENFRLRTRLAHAGEAAAPPRADGPEPLAAAGSGSNSRAGSRRASAATYMPGPASGQAQQPAQQLAQQLAQQPAQQPGGGGSSADTSGNALGDRHSSGGNSGDSSGAPPAPALEPVPAAAAAPVADSLARPSVASLWHKG